MSTETPKRDKVAELSPEIVLSREHLSFKVIPFETALGYMAEVAAKNKSANPEIVVVFGNPGSGKTYFSRKLTEAVSEKTKEASIAVRTVHGLNDMDLVQVKKWQEDDPDTRLSMIVVQTTAPSINSGQDILSAKNFNRFPSTILYIFDPRKEQLDQDFINEQLVNLIRDRRQYSKNFNVPYIPPEVYFVKNSREENITHGPVA